MVIINLNLVLMNLSEGHITLPSFNESLNNFTLTFKDPKMERKYREKRIIPLNITKTLKVFFALSLIWVIICRIEIAVFSLAKLEQNSEPELAAYVNSISLGAVCVIEWLITHFERLIPMRGFAALVYAFFSVGYSFYLAGHQAFHLTFMLASAV